ncbi:PAS domain-containing sensor histidine kinase [Pontibacter sp. E15-1]|uniref:sensor histidine kinase n=1 Tax=Pontibacter sp. E15-1 TaxID=2919918 RepID=UPI001F4F3B02|nr:PAS domain-containing sensor histidine kinase [Pontibacter sp. E15-1]MCJ8165535.1 PAS domain-containing sensor histidine kinase [Pontibacter sp. E15-1]
MSTHSENKSIEALRHEINELHYKLQVAEDTIEAIRTGAVDALAVQDNGVTKIFTLEGAEQTYRVLVENMSEGAVTLNQDGLILYSNSQFAKLINLPLSEVIGSSFDRFVSPEYEAQFRRMFLRGWTQQVSSECIVQPDNSDALHVYISLTTIADKDEEVLGMIVTNLSEQKELEKLTQTQEELSRKNEELIKINDDLDTFVYTASHDLKNPILNIEGLVAVLDEILENNATEEVKVVLKLINNSVARFKTTILDLTEISKVQKGVTAPVESVNCHQTIQEVLAELQQMITAAHAEVSLDIGICPEFQFSRKNFQSIVYNLLSNAIKYRAPDRRLMVHVKMEKLEEYILLRVQDNGLGIDLKHEAKLFSMFERLHNHVEGSGVGLYIVKRIIDNAGGKITVESEVGKGSTFSIYFKRPQAPKIVPGTLHTA